jgi:hypothetical protein
MADRGAGFSRFLLFAAGEGESLSAVGPCSAENALSPMDFEVTMPTDAEKRDEMRLALLSVISCLIDSQKGYAEIGDHLKHDELKRFFHAESLKRAQFRGDLEEILHQNGLHDIKESGSTAGKLHRAWGPMTESHSR